MKSILQRLEEMPYGMLVRVARKFHLNLTVQEEKQSIIRRLEEVITDYFLEQEEVNNSDNYVDRNLAKYNLLADFEVPHDIHTVNDSIPQYNTITYINMMLIDEKWCFIYWNFSQYDYERVKIDNNFSGLYLHIIYNKQGFKGKYLEYDQQEIIPVTLQDIDQNYYQQHHYTYCCCQLIAKYQNQEKNQLLAVSGEVFLPHKTPSWERHKLPVQEYLALQLSIGNHDAISQIKQNNINYNHDENQISNIINR